MVHTTVAILVKEIRNKAQGKCEKCIKSINTTTTTTT